MPTLLEEIRSAFIASGIKSVARNDKRKGAYVLTKEQVGVLERAGFAPDRAQTIPVRVVGIDQVLESSYYTSVREGSGRTPEPRMGREIVHWLHVGDRLLLATDGKSIFAHKIQPSDRDERPVHEIEKAVGRTYSQIDPKRLRERAQAARRHPKRIPVIVQQFVRDAAVRAYVALRSAGKCEAGCGWAGFKKEDGQDYIQIHHVTWLAKGGEDTVENTVALCPNCHAKAHFSGAKETFAKQLRAAVRAADEGFRRLHT